MESRETIIQLKNFEHGFIRNIFYSGISGFSAGLLLVLLILAGRFLGDEQFGKFSFALALVTIFSALLDFGINEVTIRSVAQNHKVAGVFLGNTFSLKLVLVFFMMVFLYFTVRALRHEPDVRMVCYLLGAAAILRSYLITIRSVLQGLEWFRLESIIAFTERFLLLLFGMIVLIKGYGLIQLAVAFIIARIATIAVTFPFAGIRIGSLRPRFDTSFWYKLQISALPFGFFLIVLSLYSYIDTVMLGVLRNDVETGLYGAAYRVYEGLAFIPLVIQKVLLPRLSENYVNNRLRHMRLAHRGTISAFLIAIPVAGLVFALAAIMMNLLFGAPYVPAKGVLQILTVGLVFVFPIWILHAIAISISEDKILVKSATVGLVVNLVFNVVLIPLYGMYGAAIATVAGEAVSFWVLFRSMRIQGFFRIGEPQSRNIMGAR